MPPFFSDEELIRKTKEGDKAAFKELFLRHNEKILGYLYRYVGDYQKAEEITIDTFLDVYKRLADYKEQGKFLSWVYKIATNYAKMEFRRKKRVREISFDTPFGESQESSLGDILSDSKTRPDYEVIEKELYAIIEEIIQQLDEKYRSVLLLCDMQGMSYEEAAFILKCNKMTVGTRLRRAKKLLHQALKERGYNI